MERYKLTTEGEACYCVDRVTGLTCSFERGKFNSTQHFDASGVFADIKSGGAGVLARIAGEMGDWLAHNAREEVVGDE